MVWYIGPEYDTSRADVAEENAKVEKSRADAAEEAAAAAREEVRLKQKRIEELEKVLQKMGGGSL